VEVDEHNIIQTVDEEMGDDDERVGMAEQYLLLFEHSIIQVL